MLAIGRSGYAVVVVVEDELVVVVVVVEVVVGTVEIWCPPSRISIS